MSNLMVIGTILLALGLVASVSFGVHPIVALPLVVVFYLVDHQILKRVLGFARLPKKPSDRNGN